MGSCSQGELSRELAIHHYAALFLEAASVGKWSPK